MSKKKARVRNNTQSEDYSNKYSCENQSFGIESWKYIFIKYMQRFLCLSVCYNNM